MRIYLDNAGKRYNREWIFRQVNFEFESGNSYAITGANGTGKSTLLQVLSGALMLNEGHCTWNENNEKLRESEVYTRISLCAPYLELVEEMTLTEFLAFHQSFKPFLPGMGIAEIIAEIGLQKASAKRIGQYSSGMKQRVKLAQGIFSDTPVVLLDEPCTNLDTEGIELYNKLIEDYCAHRLTVVSSNDETEYQFCKEIINIMHYKS